MDGYFKYCMLCYLFHYTQALSTDECTFEDGFCYWKNKTTEDSGWIRTQGDLKNGSLPSIRTKTDGYFIAMTHEEGESTRDSGTGKIAKLISPQYSQGLACFRSWYSLTNGKQDNITINVWETTRKEKMVILRNSDNGKWKQVVMNFNPSKAFQIEIVGKLGNDSNGYVAIDDTVITSGSLCLADCNFENGFCAWVQQRGTEDDFNWKRISGSTPSQNTGRPKNDHTSGGGYYIYIESNNKSETDTARLSVLLDGNGRKCFSFWFYMYGDDVNSLHVYFKTHATGEQRAYSANKSKGNQWIEAQIDMIDDVNQITLEGVAGAGDLGDIAVDDISIRSGVCKPSPSENEGSLIAVYILIPTIIVIAVVSIVAILIWRKRHSSKRTPSNVPREITDYSNSSITNKTYSGHVVENQSNDMHSKVNKTVSDGSEYAVITDDNIHKQDGNNTEYNTINMNQKNHEDRDYGYDRLKHTLSPFVDKSYSHVSPKDNDNLDKQNGIVKPFDASRNEAERRRIAPSVLKSKGDKCFGSIPYDTSQGVPKFAFEIKDELDVEYDHAIAGGLDSHVEKRDDYSHLHRADSNTGARKDKRANQTKKNAGYPKGNIDKDVTDTQDSSFHEYFVLEKEP